MTFIWGLDLKEIQLKKFKGSYIFNQQYHLRRTKMIIYQIAMILCVCSESVGTAALSDYVDLRDSIFRQSGSKAVFHCSDFVGIASCNIFIGISVATIFGSSFFFDLIWPERTESLGVKWAWKISSVFISMAALAVALAMTVIVTMRSAYITGLNLTEASDYFQSNTKPNLIYRKNPYCVAATILLWLGAVAVFLSTLIMIRSIAHNETFGAKSSKFKEGAISETARNTIQTFDPRILTNPMTVASITAAHTV